MSIPEAGPSSRNGNTPSIDRAVELSVPSEIRDALAAANIDLGNPQNQLIVQTVYDISAHFGGWPPSDLVAECERASPGSSKLLIELVAKSLDQRHEMAKSELKAEVRLQTDQMRQDTINKIIGQVFGGGTSLTSLIVAGWIATSKPDSGGVFLALVAIVAGIGGPPAARLLLEWLIRRKDAADPS